MSVLIIKRDLSGTKQLKSHYQTSLWGEGRGRGERRLYIYMSHIHKYISPHPPLIGCAVVKREDDAGTLYMYVCQC